MDKKRLYLVDGANFLYRAFYAIRNLSNSKGFPTGALYGFTKMLLKLLRDEKPDLLAVCFDTAEPTFRDEMFGEYKANRKAPPDDLVEQFPYVRPIVDALGIPVLEKPGFEADDIIGTLASRFSKKGCEVVIVSGDKDLMQLVGGPVSMLDEMKDLRIGPKEVEEKFGVMPEGVVEVLGLAGDASDNIPGVSGIGPKTAAQLIKKYGTIENVIASAGELEDRLSAKIKRDADSARMSRKLAKIDTDVDIYIDEEGLKKREPVREKVEDLFRELEFSKLLAEITGTHLTNMPKAKFRMFERDKENEKNARRRSHSYVEDVLRNSTQSQPNSRNCSRHIYEMGSMQKAISHEGFKAIDDIKILKKAVQDIKKNGRFGITVHLSSGKPMDADMLGLAIALDERRAFYIPIVRVEGKGAGETMELFGPKEASFGAKVPEILNVLKEVFEDEKFMAAGHDLNLMLTFFKRFGIEFKCRLADAMVESYVLNPGESHEIEFLTEKYLGCKVTGLDEIAGKEKEQIPTEAACGYYCERASAVLSLSALFGDKMREGGFLDLYEKLEEPVIRVLAGMQFAGVKVDIQKLEAQGKVINGKLGKLEEKIYVLAGEKFNINSPRQLGEILFGKMKLPGAKKTKTGFSTSQDILEDLSIKHELPAIILDYRTLSKLKSTYIDALPLIVTKETCRIHTSFNQAVAATGRLTSSDPNLQNIPIRAEEGRKIREAFVAEEGFVLLSADYSQIELRVLAHMSGDESLLDAFKKGEDVHTITAAGIFGVDLLDVTLEQRAVGKTVNFATIYGQTAFGLSKQLKIDVHAAAGHIENYFKKYPGVGIYRDKVLASAKKNGYVETLFGRRRYFPDITSSNAMLSALAERMAFNTVFQGTAADIIKRAMIVIDAELRGVSSKTRMTLQVHDELLFEVPKTEIDKVAAFVKEKMEGAADLKAPLTVVVGTGINWAEV